MSSLKLNQFNNSFQVDDKHGHTRLMLTKLVFIDHPTEKLLTGLRLEIQDENEIILFNELIAPFLKNELPEKVAYIHQEFAIYNHLTVRLATAEPDTKFAAEIHFDLKKQD